MLHQRAQDLIGQRQFQRRGDLALVDSQDALSPMEYAAGDRIQQPEARQQAPEPLRLPPPLSQLPGDLAKDEFGQKGWCLEASSGEICPVQIRSSQI